MKQVDRMFAKESIEYIHKLIESGFGSQTLDSVAETLEERAECVCCNNCAHSYESSEKNPAYEGCVWCSAWSTLPELFPADAPNITSKSFWCGEFVLKGEEIMCKDCRYLILNPNRERRGGEPLMCGRTKKDVPSWETERGYATKFCCGDGEKRKKK